MTGCVWFEVVIMTLQVETEEPREENVIWHCCLAPKRALFSCKLIAIMWWIVLLLVLVLCLDWTEVWCSWTQMNRKTNEPQNILWCSFACLGSLCPHTNLLWVTVDLFDLVVTRLMHQLETFWMMFPVCLTTWIRTLSRQSLHIKDHKDKKEFGQRWRKPNENMQKPDKWGRLSPSEFLLGVPALSGERSWAGVGRNTVSTDALWGAAN